MKYPFYTTDVFTKTPFGGNQLAVLPESTGIAEGVMQAIAREFNLSNTAFVLPPRSPDHALALRIFTRSRELQFAGHPTLGTAFILASNGVIPLEGDVTRVVFEERVGDVPVEIHAEGGAPTFTRFISPKLPEFGPPPPPVGHIAAMLSLAPGDVLDDDKDEPRAVSCGLPFLFVPLASLDAVRRARFNWEWWQQTLATYWAPMVFLFSYETEGEDTDIHARMFYAQAGYEEDPGTGAAASALAGYLASSKAVGDGGTHRWTVEQGIEMGRPSRMEIEADKLGGRITETRVGGHCVLVGQGEIEIP